MGLVPFFCCNVRTCYMFAKTPLKASANGSRLPVTPSLSAEFCRWRPGSDVGDGQDDGFVRTHRGSALGHTPSPDFQFQSVPGLDKKDITDTSQVRSVRIRYLASQVDVTIIISRA